MLKILTLNVRESVRVQWETCFRTEVVEGPPGGAQSSYIVLKGVLTSLALTSGCGSSA